MPIRRRFTTLKKLEYHRLFGSIQNPPIGYLTEITLGGFDKLKLPKELKKLSINSIGVGGIYDHGKGVGPGYGYSIWYYDPVVFYLNKERQWEPRRAVYYSGNKIVSAPDDDADILQYLGRYRPDANYYPGPPRGHVHPKLMRAQDEGYNDLFDQLTLSHNINFASYKFTGKRNEHGG